MIVGVIEEKEFQLRNLINIKNTEDSYIRRDLQSGSNIEKKMLRCCSFMEVFVN